MSKDYFTLSVILLSIFLFLFFYFAGLQAGYNSKCKVEFTNRIIMYCPNNVVEHDYSQDMCVYEEYDYSQDLCPIDNNLYCPYYVFEGGF